MYFDVLLFDLDGTLIDSLPDITAAVNHALAVLHLPPRCPEEVRGHVGQGAAHLLSSLLGVPTAQDPLVQTLLPHFLGWYETHVADQTVLYPGIRDMLDALSSVDKVVISNKPSRLARAALESLGVADQFRAIHGGEDFPRKKPDPLPLVTVLDRLGVAPARAMMIGDSQFDILAGRAAGTATCAVSWGLGLGPVLLELKPDVLIERPGQLLDVLRGWSP